MKSEKQLHIFTWHIHGSYLYYLSQGNYIIYIPVNETKTDRNIGRGQTFPFGNNVIEVPVDDIPNLQIDCILYQHKENYTLDQYKLLTKGQRQLPRIYLEHDPPWQHPTNTKHVVQDPDVLVVHVTHFNKLMWDNHGNRTTVIEHGVSDKGVPYDGSLEKGIVVINNLPTRGRLLGFDIFEEVKKHIPLDLVGMGTEGLGRGEVLHPQLPEFISRYRFFFNPIRYTSFGLAVCEAMMGGLPVVGMATTEMPTVFSNKINGIIHTDIHYLINEMRRLIDDRAHAARLGQAGRQTALARFNVRRFTEDWESVFRTETKTGIYEKADSIYQ
jgi:hypothetical protein